MFLDKYNEILKKYFKYVKVGFCNKITKEAERKNFFNKIVTVV